jgi:hypothetical protein
MDRRLSEYLRQLRVAAQDSIQFVDGIRHADFESDLDLPLLIEQTDSILSAGA